MKLAMLLVSLLTLATGVEAVPSLGPSCEEACLETCKDDGPSSVDGTSSVDKGSKGTCKKNCKKACKKCIDTMKPSKCNADTCSDPEKKWMCVKTCGLSDTCEAPDDKCEGLTDATKKNGKSKCKIMKKCGKKKDKAKAKCFLKACKKDSCKKGDGKCKKDGKNFCLRTCCENRK